LQDASDRCVLLAPELLLLELANALKAARRFTVSDVLQAVDHLLRLELHLKPFRQGTLAKAVEISADYNVSVYDSYFLATAVEFATVFVTADEVFLSRVGAHPNITSLRRLRLPE
jgi:predicted nucleic acid-binding protein